MSSASSARCVRGARGARRVRRMRGVLDLRSNRVQGESSRLPGVVLDVWWLPCQDEPTRLRLLSTEQIY